jgi:hypothetical protein
VYCITLLSAVLGFSMISISVHFDFNNLIHLVLQAILEGSESFEKYVRTFLSVMFPRGDVPMWAVDALAEAGILVTTTLTTMETMGTAVTATAAATVATVTETEATATADLSTTEEARDNISSVSSISGVSSELALTKPAVLAASQHPAAVASLEEDITTGTIKRNSTNGDDSEDASSPSKRRKTRE